MGLLDVAAQCASLANDYGSSHGSNSPSSFEVALFIGDPAGAGVEVADTTTVIDEDTGVSSDVANGYAAATMANNGTNFPAADATTGVLTTATVTFPTSTAAYPGTVTHWLLRASGVRWDSGAFAVGDRVTVGASGVTPVLTLALFYAASV